MSTIKIRTLIILLALLFVNCIVIAQQLKTKEIYLPKSGDIINVSADSLWKIIKNPVLSNWSTLIDSTTFSGSSEFEGANWNKRISVVNAKGHHESHEKLIYYNETNREMRLASTNMPQFIISNETFWKVVDQGNGTSILQIENTMRLKPFMGIILGRLMKKSIVVNQQGIFHDVKIFAETGEVSAAKKARIEELRTRGNN